MENYTAVDDREVVVDQAQIKRSCPLGRVNGNPKKHSVGFLLPFTKHTPSGFLISEFIVASLKWIPNVKDSLLILAPRQVFLSSALWPLNR